MPKKRIQSTINYYHIIIKGNNGEYIFRDDKDKNFYLSLIFKSAKLTRTGIIAWCIMDNHAHILAKVNYNSFAKFFKNINIKYAMHYNKKNKRTGYVFQKAKTVAIDTEEGIINNMRYIHNNPVKASMVKYPNEYKFSSYRYYISNNISKEMETVKSYIAPDNEGFINFHNSKEIKGFEELYE